MMPWRTIHDQHPAPGGRGGPELDEQRRRTASDFIWTRVTGSERRLAPHTAQTARVSWSWRRISHAKAPGPGSPCIALRRLLEEYARDLASRIDAAPANHL
ncbi:hypothetical protein [Streptomyces sp. NPDC001978]|uniref:hypothetical protein n=1 Tax=Streptomyces sp. NPDC001978 TaxID=3364627 RepID=UPI003698C32D